MLTSLIEERCMQVSSSELRLLLAEVLPLSEQIRARH